MNKLMPILCGIIVLASVHAGSLEEIAVFPADFEDGKYAINAGHTAPLRLSLRGNGDALVAQGPVTLNLELPDFLTLTAAHTLHPLTARMLAITVTGSRAQIALPQDYVIANVKPSFPWSCGINLYFQTAPGSAGRHGDVSITLTCGQQTEALTKHLHITAAEPLPPVFRKLRKFQIGHWYFHAIDCPDRRFFETNLQFWKDLCERPTCMIHNTLLANRDKSRITQLTDEFEATLLLYSKLDTICPNNTSYGFFERGQLKRPGVPPLIDRHGKPVVGGAICPMYMLNDPEGVFWEGHLVEGVKKIIDQYPGIKSICVDWESYPEDGTCDNCRAEFARREKLAAVPAREELASGKPLHRRWRLFRNQLRAQLIAKYSQTLKKHFPQLAQWMCTVGLEPGTDPIMGWSGIDPRSLDPHTDAFNNMLYCSGKKYYRLLESSLKGLTKPQYPLLDPAEVLLDYHKRYTPDKVCQNLLATAAFGCRKIALYPMDYYDASYQTMLRKTCNAIAEAEDAFASPAVPDTLKTAVANILNIELKDGKDTKTFAFPDLSDDFKTFFHHDGTCYYATLLNYSEHTEIFCRVALPAYSGDGTVTDLLSRTGYAGLNSEKIRSGFLVHLPPNGALLLKFGDYDHTVSTISQDDLATALARNQQALQEKRRFFQTQQSGNCSIQWVKGYNGKPFVELRDANAAFNFDCDQGGHIAAWNIPGIGNAVPGNPGQNFLGEFLFHDPHVSMPAVLPFQLDKLHFDHGRPTALMTYTVPAAEDAGGAGNPLTGLQITRENKLLDCYGSFRIVHTLTNTSQRPMAFGFRLRNIPIFRWKPGTGPQARLADGTEIPQGTNTYLKPGAKVSWSALAKPQPLDNLDVTIRHGQLWLYYKMTGDYAALYAWADNQLQTIEPVYPDITLAPGETKSYTFQADIIREPH